MYSEASTNIPEALRYRVSKPQGFPSNVKEVIFYPVTSSPSFLPGETIRYEIRSNGFLDPYTLRINFDVEVTDLDPDEVRRVDQSAHSFFNELIISTRGVIIERMQEYDVLASILHDMNYNSSDRRVKAHEGHGVSDLSCGQHVNSFGDRSRLATTSYQSNGKPLNYMPLNIPDNFSHNTPIGQQYLTTASTEGLTRNYYNDSYTAATKVEMWKPNKGTTLAGSDAYNRGVEFDIMPMVFSQAVTGGSQTTSTICRDGTSPLQHPYWGNSNTAFTTTSWPVNLKYNDFLLGIDRKISSPANPMLNISNTSSGFPKNVDTTTALFYVNSGSTAALATGSMDPWFITGACPLTGLDATRDFSKVWNYTTGDSGTLSNYMAYKQEVSRFNNTVQSFIQNGFTQFSQFTKRFNADSTYVIEPAEDNTLSTSLSARLTRSQRYQTNGTSVTDYYIYDGYKQPFNPLFAIGTDEPYFAGVNCDVRRNLKGQVIVDQGRSFLSFSVPLLSSIFGILMPPELFKYLPLAIFEDLVIELRVNQYALYSSGYKATPVTNWQQCEFFDNRNVSNQTGYQTTQNTRNFKITRCEIYADLLSFAPNVEKLVIDQWNSDTGILIQTNMWALGPQYTYPTGASVAGTQQINLSFNSLKHMIWRFIPTDFEKWSFCRKQFAVTHNLTKFQLVLGNDFLPQDGVRGQASTPFGQVGVRNSSNKEFFTHMLKAFNRQHDMKGNISINPFNFAINDRPYNPAETGSYMSCYPINDSSFSFSAALTGIPSTQTDSFAHLSQYGVMVTNGHTALQLPAFHEQRCVGKCTYGFDTETLSSDWNVLSGLNTYDFKPFNIVFETDQQATQIFSRDSRLYMFFMYDAVVQLKSGMAPVVVGRS